MLNSEDFEYEPTEIAVLTVEEILRKELREQNAKNKQDQEHLEHLLHFLDNVLKKYKKSKL